MFNSRVISSAWGHVSSISLVRGDNSLTRICIAGLTVSVPSRDMGLPVVKAKFSKGKKIFVLFESIDHNPLDSNPDVGCVLAVYSITNRQMVQILQNWIKDGPITNDQILSYRPCYSF